jgi:hypothetical protein
MWSANTTFGVFAVPLLPAALLLPASCMGPSARKERGPQDDKVRVWNGPTRARADAGASLRSLDSRGVPLHEQFLVLQRFQIYLQFVQPLR